MLRLGPTHIGLDIAERILEELQPDTLIQITNEFLEVINDLLNKSIGLGNAGIYRIADKILTLIPFEHAIFERIRINEPTIDIDVYLIHIISGKKYCYCVPFNKVYSEEIHEANIVDCVKINP